MYQIKFIDFTWASHEVSGSTPYLNVWVSQEHHIKFIISQQHHNKFKFSHGHHIKLTGFTWSQDLFIGFTLASQP